MQDLDELRVLLLARFPDYAVETIDVVTHALDVLVAHPLMGRPIGQGLPALLTAN